MSTTKPPSLRAHYLSYLNTLNAYSADSADSSSTALDLSPYVNSSLTYNSSPLTLSAYENIIVESVAKLPGLRYNAVKLAADEETRVVAARLEFVCGAREGESYRGVPGPKRMRFYEHVFYGFDEAWRVKEVNAVFSDVEVLD